MFVAATGADDFGNATLGIDIGGDKAVAKKIYNS
jgi:hypothetical protein